MEEAIYIGHQLVNQIHESSLPVVYLQSRFPVGYGKSLACAAHFCLDSSSSGDDFVDTLDHFPAASSAFFADWKQKFEMEPRDARGLRSKLFKLSADDDEDVDLAQKISNLLSVYETGLVHCSDFCFNTVAFGPPTHESLPAALGHDYLAALNHLEAKKRESFDMLHYNKLNQTPPEKPQHYGFFEFPALSRF